MNDRGRPGMWRLLAVLLAFALIAAACGGGDDDDAEPAAGGSDTEVEAGTGADDEPGGEPADAPADEPADEPDDSGDAGDAGDAGDSGAIQTEAADDSDLTAVEGGTLRFGLEADVDGLNPTTSALSAPGLTMALAVFDPLAAYDENGVAVPYLAESFTPNDDFTSWTMVLRDGITFHDGTPLDAEAVRVNFETTINDPLVGLAMKPFYPPIEEGPLEIVDDLTVVYNLLDSDAYFPASLASQLGYMASPTWLAAALEDPTLNQEPVGTGPFVFDSRSADSVTRFVRNESWWNGRANLDAIEFIPVTDGDVSAQLLLEGELNGLATTNVGAIDNLAGDDSIQNILDDSGEESFAQMNTAKAPFDDIRARMALTHATPRNNYVTLINLGVPRPADQIFTPDSPYYAPGVTQLSDMPELAGPLVEEYCADVPDSCSNGKIDVELQWSGPSVVQTRIAELLNEGWEPYFNVEFQELLQDQHINEVAFGLYDVVTWRLFGNPEFSRDAVWLTCRTIGGISLNWVRFCDEERDALLLEAQATLDQDRRAELYQEFSANLSEDFLYILFNHTLWDVALGEDVRNLCGRTSPDGVPLRCTTNGVTRFDTAFIAE